MSKYGTRNKATTYNMFFTQHLHVIEESFNIIRENSDNSFKSALKCV